MKPTTVPTSRSRIRCSPEQGRNLCESFQHNGQTGARFCTEQGLASSSSDRWRHKLRYAAPRGEAVAEDSLFVELPPDAELSVKPTWDVDLELGAGVVLRLRRPCCASRWGADLAVCAADRYASIL